MKMNVGDIVFCQSCKKDLYKFNKERCGDDIIRSCDLEPIGDIPLPNSGDRTLCPYCNYDWHTFSFGSFLKKVKS